MSEPLLALRDIAGARGGRTLFEGVSLELDHGDAAIVTGPNGTGKSTLLRIAAGLFRAAAGSATRSATVALLSETSALDPERRLGDALEFWAALDDTRDPRQRVAAALAAVDLAPIANVPVRMLSTGQRRRAGLARVLVSQAPVWLLDEPANGLDEAAVTRLEAIVAEHRATGGAALIATHLPLHIPDASPVRLGAPEPLE